MFWKSLLQNGSSSVIPSEPLVSGAQVDRQDLGGQQQRDRDDDERVPAGAQHDEPGQDRDDDRGDPAERGDPQWIDAGVQGDDRDRVRPEAEEHAVAEGGVAGVPGDDVPADRLDGEQEHQQRDALGVRAPRVDHRVEQRGQQEHAGDQVRRSRATRPGTASRRSSSLPAPRILAHADPVLAQPRAEQALRPDQQHHHDHQVEHQRRPAQRPVRRGERLGQAEHQRADHAHPAGCPSRPARRSRAAGRSSRSARPGRTGRAPTGSTRRRRRWRRRGRTRARRCRSRSTPTSAAADGFCEVARIARPVQVRVSTR